ncbi:MAG: YdcF family protein [Verrucomicrobia bacterium]|nr:YdcF family protein [Verrucomicrobiota bacterium]
MKPHAPFWGLFRRRECLAPTWRGWALMLAVTAALVAGVVGNIHSFLAVTAPVPAEALVVEGWTPDYVFKEAIAEFKRHPYRKVYVTGGSLEQGAYLSEYQTYANLGAALLVSMGLNREVVQAVPAERVRQDRTHASAAALNTWLHQHHAMPQGLNVISHGAHARRSWLLFEKVLGGHTRVGIISIEDRDYDPKRWWKASQGVRLVMDELIAYCYARFLFSPPKEPSTSTAGAR